MRGGNSGAFYDIEGTRAKSQMLVDLHPDVAKLVKKFGRIHHEVNYKPFKNNKLIKVDPRKEYSGVNNYGMILDKTGEML